VLRAAELPPAAKLDSLNPNTERGDRVVGSADEAAVTAAADEEVQDTEGKETGTTGAESAGEAAVAEPED
jgi:hypothetical protein